MVQEITDPDLLSRLNGAATPTPAKRKTDPAVQATFNAKFGFKGDEGLAPMRTTAPDFVGISKDAQGRDTLVNPAMALNGVAGYPEIAPGTEVTDPALLNQLNGQAQSVAVESPPFMARVGRGMMDLAQGTKQIYLNATDPAAGAQYTKDVGEEIALYDKGYVSDPGRFGVDWGRLAGNIAPTAVVPFGAGARVLGVGARGMAAAPTLGAIADAAAVGAGSGALAFVPEGGSRAANAALGAAGGPAGVLGGKAIGATAGKVINTLGGKGYADPAAQATAAAARKFGVDLRAGDLKPGLANTEDMLENVPFSGAQGRLKKQADQLVAMLKMGEDKFMPAAMKPNKAGAVPFDDPNELMKVSINRQYTKNKEDVDGLYDKLRTLSGDMKFDPTESKATAQRLLTNELKLQKSQQNPALLKELEGVLAYTPMDFATAHANRSRMGATLAQLNRQQVAGTVGKPQVSAMSELQAAITKDMDAAARGGKQAFKLQNGKAVALPSNAVPGVQTRLARAWEVADKAYRTRLAPYNKPDVQKIMNGEFDTDLLADRYLKEDRPLLAKGIMDLMDNDGRQAAKYAVYKRAQNAAADPDLAAGISNKAFLNKIGLGKSNQEIFDPQEQKYLNEIADVLRHTRRAASHNFNPKTGNRAAQLMASGGLAAPFLMTDLATAGGLTASAALTGRAANAASWSDLGKSALLSSGDVPGLQRLVPGLLNRTTSGLGGGTLLQLNMPRR